MCIRDRTYTTDNSFCQLQSVPNHSPFPLNVATDGTYTHSLTTDSPVTYNLVCASDALDVILMIDTSGSMNDDGSNPEQPMTATIQAAINFINGMRPNNRVGIVRFNGTATLTRSLNTNKQPAISSVSGFRASGGTNMTSALNTAKTELTRDNPATRKVAILITDGIPNNPTLTSSAATTLKNAGVELFTIGLGTKVKTTFLTNLASEPDNYYAAPTASDIDEIYGSISETIIDASHTVNVVPTVTLERRIGSSGTWATGNISIDPGQEVQLKWSSTNADEGCEDAADSDNSFSVSATSGTDTDITEPGNNSSIAYGVICTGAGGTVSDSLIVTTIAPPTATLEKNIFDGSGYTTGNAKIADGNQVHLRWDSSCLLYTSPSPRDRTRSRMPSSA